MTSPPYPGAVRNRRRQPCRTGLHRELREVPATGQAIRPARTAPAGLGPHDRKPGDTSRITAPRREST